MSKNIILVDERIQSYETITSAVNNDTCVYITIDYYTETVENIKSKILNKLSFLTLDSTTTRCIGLIQHNYNLPFYSLVQPQPSSENNQPGSIVFDVKVKDPLLESWSELRDFITWCKTTPEVNAQYFDMMACALYSDTNWKYIINTLTAQTGVTLRASTDNTGASSLGGNWFLESHTGVNLKDVYFTDLIDEYRGLLYNVSWINTSAQQLKSMSPGRAIIWGDGYAQTTANYNSNSNLQSDIISICTTSENYGHWSALKTNGTVITSFNSGGLVTIGGQTLTNVVAIYSNAYGFAGLTSTGRVATWGSGSIYEVSIYDSDYYSVTSSLQSGCIDVFSQPYSFVALKNDGTTVAWGLYMEIYDVNITGTSGQFSCSATNRALYVGSLIKLSGTFSGTGSISGYVNPTTYKISSLTSDYYGYVVGFTLTTTNNVAITTTPGTTTGLTYSNKPFDGHSGIVTIVSNSYSYAALKSNGSVVAWGNSGKGGDTSITIMSGPLAGNTVQSQLNSDVVSLYCTANSFAALKSNGNFIFWASTWNNTTGSATDVVYAVGTMAGMYALKADGGIIAYEVSTYHLSLPSNNQDINQAVSSNVTAIYSTLYSVTLLKRNSSIFVYGDSFNGAANINVDGNNVVDVYSGGECMAALKTNGSLVTWGHEGGNSSSVSSFLSSNVVAAYPASQGKDFSAMLALNNSGEVKAWGKSDRGGVIDTSITSQVTSGIVAVYSSLYGYYVIKSSASSFDLSASYYRPIDRYRILREKNNRRRTNLNTLNNNVFTLSTSSELSKININIPTNKTLRIIVPNYSSTVSFTSTATLPNTSGNFIIACEECEPVLISGTRYINYGGYVYNDSTSNFTKLTTASINDREYTLYGGSGGSNQSLLSGIVFLEIVLEVSTFSASTFTVASSKTFGDASFAITTLPTSNSNGAITYSSSNTAVATIDVSGNFITLVGAGDVSFNATQASTAQYARATITSNTLTVSRATSTLSSTTFSVASSKTFGDASFVITTRPTSNNSSVDIVYSSSNTAVATIDASGNFITLVGAGDVSFNATQVQTNQYNAASNTSNTLTVSRGTSTLSSSTFTVASSKTFGDASFAITTLPTSNSSGEITYSSSNTAVATIDASGNWITIVGIGDVSFNATQAQTNQYNAASKTSNTLTVSKATPTLAFVSPPATKNVTDAAFTVTASSASSGAITYSSSNTSFATVNPSTGLVTLKSAGTVTITASQASTATYEAPTNATYSIVIASAGTALQGQTVSSSTSYASVDLSGASLVGTTVSGVSFSGANLSNVNFSGAVITGTDFTNANISGSTNLPTFSTVQKLQLLKNINNVGISAIQVATTVSGSEINALLASPDSTVASATFTIKAPTSIDASSNKVVTISLPDISGSKSVYIPMNVNETVKINNDIYSFDGTNILDVNGNPVTYITFLGTPFKIYVGSVILVNIEDALNKINVLGDGLYTVLSNIFSFKYS